MDESFEEIRWGDTETDLAADSAADSAADVAAEAADSAADVATEADSQSASDPTCADDSLPAAAQYDDDNYDNYDNNLPLKGTAPFVLFFFLVNY